MVDSTMSQQNFFADGDDGLGDNGPFNAQHIDPALRAPDTRKRPAPPDNERPGGDDAAAVVAEMAEDDARERKLTSVSHWQVFLYHSRRPENDEENIKAVYGESVDPHSLEWTEARARFMNDQKNLKFRVVKNMEALLKKHAEHPGNALMLDIRVDLSRPVLKDIAHRAFSPENWLKLAMFQGLAVEVAEYLRAKAKDTDTALARRQELLEFYDDMPKKNQYKHLTQAHFHQVFERQRRQKKQ
ncbi:predicted protein [Chaetomium globosum CBS 148.51]|uniref:Uncharacterized protein n=1 Tax=Chaetomium globosum (strain ATCC 6205 / CBS 148.51 / DSM 1962 / NBRC 6347 / NRRL 1970) TaxID=306901 RepID=Q2H2G1_CHAGB|nr:uncharacterized protein CHGG_04035 [Chaetomium globosum CBS 148.51]EAQ87416.1 predicted protein [Chaetomium globosum CBS 148.51]